MTKDRALRVLDVYASVNGSGQCTQDEFEEAKKMAIEALESQDRQVIIAGSYLLEGEDNVPDTNVGDIISRQAAISLPVMPKEYRKYQTYNLDDAYEQGWEDLQECIERLPSAQPERGEWIPVTNGRGGFECSKCHDYAPSYQNGDDYLSRYCPNCGADMRGE